MAVKCGESIFLTSTSVPILLYQHEQLEAMNLQYPLISRNPYSSKSPLHIKFKGLFAWFFERDMKIEIRQRKIVFIAEYFMGGFGLLLLCGLVIFYQKSQDNIYGRELLVWFFLRQKLNRNGPNKTITTVDARETLSVKLKVKGLPQMRENTQTQNILTFLPTKRWQVQF